MRLSYTHRMEITEIERIITLAEQHGWEVEDGRIYQGTNVELYKDNVFVRMHVEDSGSVRSVSIETYYVSAELVPESFSGGLAPSVLRLIEQGDLYLLNIERELR